MIRDRTRTRRRGRSFTAAHLAAFAAGFAAGVASIQSLSSPPERLAADRLALPGPRSSTASLVPDVLLPGAFFGLYRREEAAATSPGAQLPVTARLQAAPRRAALGAQGRPEGMLGGAAAAPQARLAKALLPYDPPAVEAITVRRGDTLMDILIGAGIQRAEAHAAITALSGVYDPRRLQAGQELLITAAGRASDSETVRELLGLTFELSFEQELHVTRGADGAFASSTVERPQRRELVLRGDTISDSLYLSAARAALPQELIIELIKLFSWDVDFQRDIRAGDAFETLYEEVSLESRSDQVRSGDLLYARLALSGRELEGYRFERPDGTVDYFDRTGRSLRKFLLRTPVDGARMSSRFGMRKHPILGYSRMHKGVDFAAPTGTPIYAAGAGRVVTAGRNGGYGNYVRLRHTGEYDTAYAHLSRFGKGIRPGARVRQGQIIGYVGTTGRSTGPHLHYEVLKAGSQINPLSLKHPPTAQLAGAELDRFRAEMARIDRLRGQVANGTQVASRGARAEAAGGG